MKILFVSNLFPDATNPNRGLFNARLVKHLGAHAEIRVISPRPTRGLAPFWRAKTFAPRPEDAWCAPVFPPTAYLPKIGDRWNHRLMARSLREAMRATRAKFPFDVVLAAWVYPDACAVAALAREMDFRFVAIAQGSDVHQYLQIPARRRIISTALNQAGAVITRSGELARLLRAAGVAADRLHPIYNGVEADVFQPGDPAAARTELKLPVTASVLLFVGNFLSLKNPLLLVDAFAELARRQPEKNLRLVLLGEGPLHENIRRRAHEGGVGNRVMLPGRKAPAEVARFMQAADLLVVPSDNEGVPNVIYEAMSCGLRTVATRVGGIPEILTADFLGQLVERKNPAALAQAIAALLATPAAPEKIIFQARQFSWKRTAAEHLQVLTAVLNQPANK